MAKSGEYGRTENRSYIVCIASFLKTVRIATVGGDPQQQRGMGPVVFYPSG